VGEEEIMEDLRKGDYAKRRSDGKYVTLLGDPNGAYVECKWEEEGKGTVFGKCNVSDLEKLDS
jgi:hypothetical protein